MGKETKKHVLMLMPPFYPSLASERCGYTEWFLLCLFPGPDKAVWQMPKRGKWECEKQEAVREGSGCWFRVKTQVLLGTGVTFYIRDLTPGLLVTCPHLFWECWPFNCRRLKAKCLGTYKNHLN